MDTKFFIVKNRSAGVVVYNIPEKHIRREFAAGESKRLSLEELQDLTFQPGGRALMQEYLQIEAEEVTEELGIKREPEYDMSENDIIELIKNGSQDEFLDCLDFAPAGVIDLIKKFAVELPMSDTNKIDALKEKTGFNVTVALANMQKEREDEKSEASAAPEAKTRRVKKEEGATSGRRTSSKYRVKNSVQTEAAE